jgi:hypothetical protein
MLQASIWAIEGVLCSGGAISGGLRPPRFCGSDDRWRGGVVVGLGEMCVGSIFGGGLVEKLCCVPCNICKAGMDREIGNSIVRCGLQVSIRGTRRVYVVHS